MKNNREMFMKWLNGRETPDRLRDYSTVFPAIEAYAKSKKIIYGPIFDIDDPAIIETISQMLSNDKVFRLWHKKRIKTMTDALELFGKYTRESAMEADVPAEPSSEEDTSEPNQTEPVQAEPVISVPENTVSSADNAEITAKRESFANWLKLQPGYTEATADEYAKAISDIDGFAKEYGLVEKSFYLAADNTEISAMFRAILQSDEYFKVIDNTHRLLFMGAISRYNSFLTAAKENPAETPAQADALEPEKPAEPVCPEVAASKPEKPAEPVYPEVAASKPEKPAEPACSEVGASVPENTVSSADAGNIEAARRSFIVWMKQNSYVDLVIEKTVKSISAVDDFAKKNALLDKSIFLAKDEDELHQAVSKITLSGKFNTAFDGRQGKAFGDALERYNSFLKSASEDVAGLVPTGVPRELTQDEIDKADEMRQEFCRWMKRLKYSDAAAEKTAELISTVDDFCEKYRLLKKSIFLIKSNEELQQALRELRKSSKYEYAYNSSQHLVFSAALNRYGNFLLSDHIKQAEQRKQAIAEKKRIEAERLANAARIEAEQNMPEKVAAVSAAETAPEKPAEPARQQAPAQSEYQAAERSYTARTNGGRDEFMQWLINGGTPSGTANSYTNSVESLGEAMRQRGIEPRSIFSIGDEQRLKQLMEEMLRCRILTPVAPETRAFKKYIVFRMNGTAKNVPIVPAASETMSATQRYATFAKPLTAKEPNASKTDIPQNVLAVSLREKLSEDSHEKESTPSENKKEDNALKVDFLHIGSFAYTKPISFSYFGDEQTDISNWTQLYVKILACLSKDYPNEILRMYNTNINGGRRIDFGTQEASEEMKAPKKVNDNFYAETNLSATDIVTKIRTLLDRCNVDYENLAIYYIKFESTQQAETLPMGNAQMPAASALKTAASTVAMDDTENYKELFRNWLLHDQHLADHSALSYSSAISNCEQMAFQLGLPKTKLYGADCAAAQQIAFQLMQTDEYLEANISQHNRYSAAMAKYQLYLQSADPQEPAMPAASTNSKTERHVSTFEELFEDEKYEPLYKELKKKGIATLEELKEVNLWSFMNLHQLYPIQQRLAISTELTAKLRDAGKEDNEQNASTYEIHYNGNIYKGTSPSKAFVAFLAAIATRYPLKFRAMLNVYNPEFQRIVISRYDYENTKLKLLNPEAYIDSDLTLIQVRQYIAWVIKRCDATPSQYTVEEKTNSIELPQRKTADLPDLPAEKPQKPPEKPTVAADSSLMQEAEDYLLQRDLEGATYDELQNKLRCTMVSTKEIVAQSPHIIEMNQKLYHEEALVDFEDGADALEAVLDKLLKKNDGIATAKHLYEYARSEMTMFLNDNDITDQQSVYDLARHLFEKLKYHGKQYVFKYNMYISLPDVSAGSAIDIIKKYAREKGSTVTYKEIESYLAGLGLNTGNLRGLMRIDKEPVFLIYAENEYLLAELMHIDADFLESIHRALRRLFADTDGHIIPRNISESWYNLLPGLPAGLEWTPMLLQQLIRFYPNELEARSIIAMESQSSNTLHAMFVEKDSWIQDFRDVVAVFLHNEMPDRNEFEAEELREILVNAGMVSGNQLVYNMHNALGSDPRFLWNSDGNYVKVRI